ncbi:hypothetical protein [Mesorhizobium sp. ISC15]|uniref:hypothetical protein n=1 Tax=Mesorhizobium sp. ISC15 TaxID=3076429 RepID=UPI00301C4118
MATGLDSFKEVLAEYRSLALWAGVSSVSIPFFAAFAGVAPPWPNRIALMTAVFQLIGLILSFQLYYSAKRRVVTKAIIVMTLASCILLLLYIFLFSIFAVSVGGAQKYIIVGYECTTKAAATYGKECQGIGYEELRAAQFNEFVIWTRMSIAVVRTALTSIWLAFFLSLSSVIALFLVFQRSRVVKPT